MYVNMRACMHACICVAFWLHICMFARVYKLVSHMPVYHVFDVSTLHDSSHLPPSGPVQSSFDFFANIFFDGLALYTDASY